jgi:hypothetical protein
MVECQICKNKYKRIDNIHIKKHGITNDQYKQAISYR